jgi:hypothetical protein
MREAFQAGIIAGQSVLACSRGVRGMACQLGLLTALEKSFEKEQENVGS